MRPSPRPASQREDHLLRAHHPYRGSWIDFEFDTRTSSTSGSTGAGRSTRRALLKALGYQPEELLKYFYPIEADQNRRARTSSRRPAGEPPRPARDPSRWSARRREPSSAERTRSSQALHPQDARRSRVWRWIQVVQSRRSDSRRCGQARQRPSTSSTMETGEVIVECNEEITEAHLDDASRQRYQRVSAALPR